MERDAVKEAGTIPLSAEVLKDAEPARRAIESLRFRALPRDVEGPPNPTPPAEVEAWAVVGTRLYLRLQAHKRRRIRRVELARSVERRRARNKVARQSRKRNR
jgi:hypothetical protein